MIKFKLPTSKNSNLKKLIVELRSTIKEKYWSPFQLKFTHYLTKKKLNLKNYFNVVNQIKIPKINLEKKIESTISSVNDEVILKQSSYWAKLLTWSLMGGTTLGVSWLAIAKTEEIIVATGKLEPIARVAEIKIPIRGVALDILVKEGEIVEKNQILIRLDTEASQAKYNALKQTLKVNKEILERLDLLVKEGAVSEVQYLTQLNKISSLEGELIENKVILKYQEIKAPISGQVFDLKPWGSGYVAESNEPVAKIVPNDNLIAKVEIDSRKIGFVSVGKLADISIDSFPATDFGVLEGKVSRIGSDSLPPNPQLNKGYRYPADIKLFSQSLKLKKGGNLQLVPGMSLTANIKLRKVSYLQLLLGTFQSKASSLREI